MQFVSSACWKQCRLPETLILNAGKNGECQVEITYRSAGVDIDAGNKAVQLIKQHVRSTFRPEVLTDVGFFGGMFEMGGNPRTVLVASADGVGTKLKIAIIMNKHDTVGMDLVNHCVNDILTCGAVPLFFLDYLATGKLVPEQVESIVKGLAIACREAGCALIGGETAEMPGFYQEGDYDLAGFIVGQVDKDRIINGSQIKAGDVLIGLPSSGLHTNGYSLVRKVFGLDEDGKEERLARVYPELGSSLGEVLLEPHRCYYPTLKDTLPKLKGLAHITGGGLTDNVPRVLPEGLMAKFDTKKWTVPPIFQLIQREGNVPRADMFRTLNMGIGMVLVVSPEDAGEVLRLHADGKQIGEVISLKEKTGEQARVIIS